MAHALELYKSIGTKLIAAYAGTITPCRVIDTQLWNELRAALFWVSHAIPEALEITVTCDASNNPPDVLGRNEVVADVVIRVTENMGAYFQLDGAGCVTTAWEV
jgi:hypothetical protein